MLLQLYFVALLRLAELASSLHAKFLIDINARLVFINTGQTRPYRQGVLATPLWTSNSRTTWEFSWRVQHASKLLAFFLFASFKFSCSHLHFSFCTSRFVLRHLYSRFVISRQTFSRQNFSRQNLHFPLPYPSYPL